MQIQRVNRTDPEKIFLIVKNVSGGTITTGMGARFVGGAAAEIVSTDGVNVVKSADAAMTMFAGIAVENIADNDYGRVQAFGFTSVLLSAEANKTVGVTGLTNSFLKAGALSGSFTSTQTEVALTTFGYKYVQCLTTTNISGGMPMCSGFVRAI